MPKAKQSQTNREDPVDEIHRMLGDSLPAFRNGDGRVLWLRQLAANTGRSIDSSGGDEASIGKALLEGFGGTWRNEYEAQGGLSNRALTALADLIGLHITLQESAGLGTVPLLAPDDLWLALYESIQCRSEPSDSSESVIVSDVRCGDVLAKVLQVPMEQVPPELFNDKGYPTKAAQQEVLSYLECANELEDTHAEGNAVFDDNDDNDDDPLAIASELAITDRPVDGLPQSQNLDTLMQDVGAGLLQLDPPWQRGDVWGLRKKRLLVDSVMLGIPLPSLIFHSQKDGDDRGITVIDGKQRLTSLSQFYDNQWKLGRYPAGSPLQPLSGKSFADLTPEQRSKFKRTQITCINFENLPTRVLYRIFELYNISGIRLNATEIRNAVFQDHPIHRMLFSIAGEGAAAENYLDNQHAFTTLLRNTISTRGSPPRFSTLDFLERYLAYSRVTHRAFTPVSTAKAVQSYFERPEASGERPGDVATEIRAVFLLAHELFASTGLNAFAIPSAQGRRFTFSKLRATTSLILARVILRARSLRSIEDQEASNAIAAVEAAVAYPDKQQTRSIWEYQARCVCELVRFLPLGRQECERAELGSFIDAMESLLRNTEG